MGCGPSSSHPFHSSCRSYSSHLSHGHASQLPGLKKLLIALAAVIALYALFWAFMRPSTNRDWSTDQEHLPTAVFDGDRVTIDNVRNFTYTSQTEYTPRWETRTYDLSKLDSAWFIVEPFGEFAGAAHTFVSFGFDGGKGGKDYVAISIEIRKEKGETFSVLGGLLRQYEVMYVVGDERDLIKLRTNFRNDTVYLYPVRTTRERMRRMFVDMLERANHLRDEPEMYNTLTNTCTTNLVRHVNVITPERIPFRPAVLLPGYSDRLAYDLGLIDTNVSFEETRKRFRINERAAKYAEAPDFSQRIRGSGQ